MIILVTFLILVLIVFVTNQTKKENTAQFSNYKEWFFWQDKNKAYSLLLHSVTIHGSSFSAFSTKRDSILKFSAQPKELKLIKKKFDKSLYKFQKCTNCHERY
ncbi:MAG: hypothetical protein H8E85_07880 [Candidatus Marinimicrobia bacterium]|nr:hypothetical protein [Candidatus Neomarinimicrobiota bacterium]